MELEDRIIPDKINLQELHAITVEFGPTSLGHPASVFVKNINDIIGTVTLPLYLSTAISFTTTRVSMQIGFSISIAQSIMRDLESHDGGQIPQDLQKYVGLTLDKLVVSLLHDPKYKFDEFWENLIKDNADEVERMLNRGKEEWAISAEDSRINNAYQQLLSSVTASIWSVFEVLCSDLWTTVVNDNPQTIGKHSVYMQPEGDRKIDLSELLYYQLDLTSNLGTVLRKKFKFSDPQKIITSFATLDESKDFIFLDSPLINLLAQLRHIIVHNAGLIDQKFIRATHQSLAEGTAYPITDTLVYDFINEVIRLGKCVLEETRLLYPASNANT